MSEQTSFVVIEEYPNSTETVPNNDQASPSESTSSSPSPQPPLSENDNFKESMPEKPFDEQVEYRNEYDQKVESSEPTSAVSQDECDLNNQEVILTYKYHRIKSNPLKCI